MASVKIRSLIVLALLSAFIALPMGVQAALVTGSISNATPPGDVITGGDWALPADVSLGWSVDSIAGGYRYTYTFTAPSPGLSHFDLQTSDNFLLGNVLDASQALTADDIDTFTVGPSNPGWPEGESLYGIKFEFAEDGPQTFWLETDRAPMEGDFYAKGGEDSFAYNSGFGSLDGANILVPDTESFPIPEPGTALLLGSGLIVIAGSGRMRFRK